MDYIRALPAYLVRCFQKLDFWLGGLAAIILFGSAKLAGLGDNATRLLTVAVIFVALFEAGYRVYREERQLRAEHEGNVRVAARITAFFR